MNRRAALAFALAIGAVPAPVWPQPARRRPYRVGLVSQISDSENPFIREFVDGMSARGYVRDRDYLLDLRGYGADRSRIAPIADELIAWGADVLIANVSSTAAVMKTRTATIPIVMATAIDPVSEGLAASLARPGGNVTGMTSQSDTLHAKLVELAHVLLPEAKRIALVVNPDHALAKAHHAVAARAAARLGLDLVLLKVRAAWEVDGLSDSLAKVEASIVSADALLFRLRKKLVAAALQAGVPTISVLSEFAAEGALATYGADLAANFRGAARYVDRILKGAKPGELPIEQPAQFELVVNVRTARALRIAIPQPVLLRADRVIE